MARSDQIMQQWCLLRKIESPRGATLAELADAVPPDYSGHRRTIRRDLESLELLFPILCERVLSLLNSGPLSRSEIVAKLGQKQPSGQLHKVIRSLLDEGSVAYTIPDKPQSRLQKYALIVGDAGTHSEKAE